MHCKRKAANMEVLTPKREKPPMVNGGINRAFKPENVQRLTYSQNTNFQAEREEKYKNALQNLPHRGGGLHAALMGVCNYGAMANIPAPIMLSDIAATGRQFKRREIEDAINKALNDAGNTRGQYTCGQYTCGQYIKERITQNAKIIQEKLIAKGGNSIDMFDVDMWEQSNPHPEGFPQIGGMNGSEHRAGMMMLLSQLYHPNDILYIGNGYEKTGQQQAHLKTAAQWITFFADKLAAIQTETDEQKQRDCLYTLANQYPFFIVNPLSGNANENGSFRSDGNVKSFRYIVVESDTLPIEKQLALLNGLELSIVALTFTGGKSIHALINVAAINQGKEIQSLEEWRNVVKENLFAQIAPLGFDPATSNPARLSRLPGIFRPDKGNFQTLLYVNQKGGALCLN